MKIIDGTGQLTGQSEAWIPTRVPVPAIRAIHTRDAPLADVVVAAMGQFVPGSRNPSHNIA